MKCMHMKTFLLRTSNCRRSTLPSNFAYSTPGLELTGIQALVSKVKRILVLIMSGGTRGMAGNPAAGSGDSPPQRTLNG